MNQTSFTLRRRKLGIGLGASVGAALAAVALAGCDPTNSSAAAGSTGSAATSAPAASGGSGGSGGSSSVAAASGAASGSADGAGSSSACTTSELSLKVVEGPQEDGSDSIGAYIVLTNTSRDTCTTAGYPGVDFYSGQTDLHEQTTRQGSGSASTVTIAPGGQATSYFTYPSGPVCDAAADAVQVIPPNQTTSLRSGIDYVGDGEATAPTSFSVCDGNIDVSPLESGYDGPH